jgi:CRISPR system Cascade subunit CasE
MDLSNWQLDSNQPLRFRIKVNPVKRDAKTRKLIPLYKRDEHLAWFHRKAEQYGFQPNSVDSIPVPNITGSKGKGSGRIKIFAVLLQGQLQVVNREKFITAICQGIGKGRSYGCGLLSIAKYR